MPLAVSGATNLDAPIRKRIAVSETRAQIHHVPRRSAIISRKVVSEDGRLLGHIDDVLIDRHAGRDPIVVPGWRCR